MELNQVVTEVIIDDSKATPGAERVLTGLQKLDAAFVKVTGAQTSALKSLERWSAAADPAIAAAQKLSRAETDLTRAMQQGLVTDERKVVILDQLRQRMAGAQTGVRGMGGAFQNASFQVADLATQVAGGTNVIRALTQQLPQLLGGFGLWGAAASAVVAVGGALVMKYVDFGETANQAAAEQEEFNKTLERASALMDDLVGKADRTRASLLAERGNIIGVAEIQVDNAQAAVAAAEARIRFLMSSASEKATKLRLRDDLSLTEPRDALKEAQGELTLLKATLGEFDDGRSRMGVRDQDLIDQLAQADKRKADEAAREADRRRREQERAEEAFGRSFDSVVTKIDPVAAAQRELAKDTEILGGAMARGIPIVGGYAAAFDKLEAAYKDKLDPTGAALRKLAEAQDLQRAALDAEAATLGMTADERAVYLAGIEAENALKKANVPLTQEGAQAYIDEARALEQTRINQRYLTAEAEQNRAVMQRLTGTVSDGFGEAARSIASAGINLNELGEIGERVLNRLIEQFIELAYVNPFNNQFAGPGQQQPTLSSLGQGGNALQMLFGGGQPGGQPGTPSAGGTPGNVGMPTYGMEPGADPASFRGGSPGMEPGANPASFGGGSFAPGAGAGGNWMGAGIGAGIGGTAGYFLGDAIGGKTGGTIGAIAGALLGAFIGYGFERGGVMTPRGPMALRRYENGGIADSPQLAMFGEGRRPEAYVPLPDGRSIPVTMRMAAGANDDRAPGASNRTTNHFHQHFNLPPQANGFGRSPQQQAGMLTERMMRSLRNTG